MMKLALGCAALSIGGFAFADGVMKPWATLAEEGRATGTTPTNAVSYFDANNWMGGTVPQGEGVRADLPETLIDSVRRDGLRFVFADRALTLGKLYVNRSNASQPSALANRACFVSDYGLTVANAQQDNWDHVSLDFGGRLYTTITSPMRALFTSLLSEICGDVKLGENATFFIAGASTRIRFDYYANSSDPVRINPISCGTLASGGGDTLIYAPCGADEQVGTWSQTAGSPFLFRTGGGAHPLAAGTIVTGEGIPAGAFLKRIFSDSMIELSAAAEETVADNSVTFAAFTPQVYLHIPTYNRSYSEVSDFGLVKYREQDVLRVEIDYANDYRAFNLLTTDDFKIPGTPTIPGTLVLHDFSRQGVPVRFGNCHVEFAETGVEGLMGGFTNRNAVVMSYEKKSVSRVTVTNGLEAVISVSNLVGTLVKDGAGTLHVGFNAELQSNTGSISVEDGVLDVTCELADDQPSIGTLSISSGATLRIPAQGLRVGTFLPAEGAVIDGPGVLEIGGTMAEYLTLRSKLVFTGGAALGFAHPGAAVRYDAPAPAVPGDPVFWVDVSKPETLTTSDASGVLRVTRIADVRGDGHLYATAAGTGPELLKDEEGRPEHVYFEYVPYVSEPEDTHALMWSENVTGICSVFKVLNPREGGGQLLGGSPFRRSGKNSPSPYDGKLFADTIVRPGRHPEMAAAEYVVNGEIVPHTETAPESSDIKLVKAFPYPGGIADTPTTELVPLVAELHVKGGIQKSTADKCSYVDNFDSEFNDDHDQGRNGGQRMYECIVYTNELTEAEKLQVRAYLMKKWLNAEPNFVRTPDEGIVAASVDAASAGTFAIAGGTSADIGTLSGTGKLVKDGAGALYVDDLSDAGTSLEVKGGSLTVRSFGYDRAGLPEGAALHVDAADIPSMTFKAGGSRMRVMEWRDWRGSDYPVLKQTASAQGRFPEYDTSSSPSTPPYVPSVVNGITLQCSEDPLKNQASLADTTGFMFTKEGVDGVYTIYDVHSIFGLYYNGYNGKIPADQRIIPVGNANGKSPGEGGHTWGFLPSNDNNHLWNKTEGYTEKTLSVANRAGGSHVRVNGVETAPDGGCFANGANVLSVVAYEEIGASALFSFRNKDGWGSGTFCIGEVILYRTALSRENAMRVEAYLRNKWYNEVIPGYRPAVVGDVKVAAGATLNVYGSAPLTASSVSCAGTISGSVALTADAVIEIPVAADGTVPAFSISGKIDVSKGGTIRLVGCGVRPVPGRYVVIPAESFAAAPVPSAWTLETTGSFRNCSVSLAFDDGALVATVTPPGALLIVR